jgi:outer membrane protein TolC
MRLILVITIFNFVASLNNAMAFDLFDAVKQGLENSKQFKIESLKLKAALNNQKSYMSEFLPNIELSYQIGEKQNIRSDNTGSHEFQTEKTNSLSITQPIFNGFKSVTNIKKGKAEYKAQFYQLENYKRELILEMIRIYLENSEYQKIKNLIQENHQYYWSILDAEKAKGTLTSMAEIIDHNIGFINNKNELNDIENKIAKARFEYETIIGEYPETITSFTPLNVTIDENTIANKLSDNPLVQQKYFELQTNELEYKKTIGNFAPTIQLSANQSKQVNLVYLDGGDLEAKTITLDLTVPLFQKGNEFFALKEARYNKGISEEEYFLTKLDIEKQINITLREYNYARENATSSINIYNLISQKYNKNYQSYKIKTISKTELLISKIDRNKALIKSYEANIKLAIAYFKLILLTENFEDVEVLYAS